ncbi:ATP-binding protein [uncultured Bacteroides sp.]|uniref:ATP-binding protein n=1 Tax=uncultured Bacteroides sp. TaxID=162156 RepID=UPI0025F89BEF|nr:transporter substrate-binding domain-containing protein [uncultured Bacteroides sp.]
MKTRNFIIMLILMYGVQGLAGESRKIIIRGDNAFPPYEFVNDKGEPDGFIVDLTRAIMEELNLPYDLQLADWSTVLQQFENKEVDLITGMAKSEIRGRNYKLSQSHSYIDYIFVCRKGESIHDVRDLSKKKIIVQRYSLPYKKLIQMNYGANLIVADNMIEGLQMLSEGEGDVAICPDNLAQYIIYKDGLTNLNVANSGWPRQEYCFVGTDARLVEQVNSALLQLNENGVYDRIRMKWFGEKTVFTIPVWVYFLLGALLLTALLLFFFVNIYKQKIKKGEKLLRAENEKLNTLLLEKRNHEKEMKEQETRLDLAMDAGNVSAWVYEPQTQKIKTLRGNALAGKGLTMEQNLSILHPDDHAMQMELFDELLSGEKVQAETIFRYMSEDGTYHYYESRMIVKKEEGKVVAILGSQKDITKEVYNNKILNNTVEKLRFAIQTAGMAMWEFDCKTQMFTAYNDPIADYQDSALVSVNAYDDCLHEEGTEWELLEGAKLIMRNGEDKSYNYIVKMKTKYDSDWQYCTVRGVPMEKDKTGRVIKYLGVRLNITEQINYQKFLEQERADAQQADKLKSAFLANMSHEIRTPLNAIVGFSELLQTTEDPEMRKEFMGIISNNNELLLRLIGDILDLSKIESGLLELKPEVFDVSAAYKETYTALKQRCTNPEVEFHGFSPYKSCKVKLDRNRVVQVGTNFITNAIKHTNKGRILMGYEYVDGGLRLYVEDTGCGIPKDKHSKLFQRFAKLDDFTQGTGLGLAICKAIIEAHGGKIGVESEEGKGSTFWAWFPCEAEIEEFEGVKESKGNNMEAFPEQAVEKLTDTHTSGARKKSVLVAEDIDSNYMLVKAILKNFELTRAKTGKEAVEFASTRRYDAILMDMKMPVMNGIEATRRIREFDKVTPIIAVTANAFDSDKVEAMEAGCNAFVTKPLKKKDLEDKLES